MNNKGVILEPQSYDYSVEEEEEDPKKQYFDMDPEKLEEILKSQRESLEDDNDDSDLSLFERKSQKMTNLFENGLVKKRMLSPVSAQNVNLWKIESRLPVVITGP